MISILFYFCKDCICDFRERVRGGKREGEKHGCVRGNQWMCERIIDWLPLARHQLGTRPATQACALTRSWTGDFLVHRLAGAQSTEAHQPGQTISILMDL